jgi:hypothetical protein
MFCVAYSFTLKMEATMLPDCTMSNAEDSNIYYRKISQGESRNAKNAFIRKTGLRAENLKREPPETKRERQQLRASYIRKHTVITYHSTQQILILYTRDVCHLCRHGRCCSTCKTTIRTVITACFTAI